MSEFYNPNMDILRLTTLLIITKKYIYFLLYFLFSFNKYL